MKPPSPRTRPSAGAKVYFPGLHGLRFFAALAVVCGHVELQKQYHGLASAADHLVVYELGRIAVTFFFVLSGFLITFLLLVEQRQGGIAIGKFYLRRALRIWPLYYLTVALTFFVVPHVVSLEVPRLSALALENRGVTLALFVGLLPHVALSLYPPVPYAEPLWSIGVEEQFYLLWPVLMARVRRVLPLALFVTAAGILVKQGALIYAATLHDPRELQFWNHFIDYFYFSRFECMAIGALGAWLLVEQKERLLAVLFSIPTQIIAYGLAAYAIVTPHGKPLLHFVPHAVLFAVIIVNVAANPRSLVKLRHPAFTWLGNISYGMYLLHEVVIGIVLRGQVWATATRFEDLVSNVGLYVATVMGTMLVATVTYRFYERWFLQLKTRVAVIASGPELESTERKPAAAV